MPRVPTIPVIPSLGGAGGVGRPVLPLPPVSALSAPAYYYSSQGFYQAAGGALASADSDPVGQWRDLSGLGRHLAQATAANKPLLRTGGNGLDGRPVVSMDGSNDFLQATLTTSATWTHVWVVRKRTVPDTTLRTLGGTTSNNAQLVVRSTISATGWIYTNNQAGSSNALGGTAAAWQILVRRYTATNEMSVWQDGSLLASIDPNDTYSSNNTFILGALTNGTAAGDFDYATLLGYTSALTNGQINTLANYLRGLYPSLPAWSDI